MRSLALRCRNSLVLAVSALLCWSTSLLAAEQISLKYKDYNAAVSVQELTNLATTGEVSPALDVYFYLTQRDPQEVQKILSREIPMSPLILELVLNHEAGRSLLQQMDQLVHPSAEQTNYQALRTALVQSARRDGKISLIEVLQNYPASEIQVEGDRLVSTYNEVSALMNRLQNLLGILIDATRS